MAEHRRVERLDSQADEGDPYGLQAFEPIRRRMLRMNFDRAFTGDRQQVDDARQLVQAERRGAAANVERRERMTERLRVPSCFLTERREVARFPRRSVEFLVVWAVWAEPLTEWDVDVGARPAAQ